MNISLQAILQELSRLDQISDMPRRVQLCQTTLTEIERTQNPTLWAVLQVELGNSLQKNPQGSRAENLEQAIVCYELTSQVHTRQAMPVEWARATMNLATVYKNRIRGERTENLERAIELYEQVLQVMTRQTMPVEWAMTTVNLANIYQSRIQGERAENLERAIELYEQALQVMTRQVMPVKWAMTTMNLATIYRSRIRGERVENLERAIELYEQALQVMTRQAMPVEWATTTMNLANTYYSRIRGERAENLEWAIAGYEQALQVRTRQTMPGDWAMTTMNLANSYSKRIQGERAENLEQAIELYEQALQVRTRQATPVDWAITTMNLALAYSERIRGERAENLERSIELYEQALQVRTRQAMPIEWAEITMNLANTYKNRIRGERAENLERAIELYEQALQVRTRQAMPIEWARATMNLATVYKNRIRGERTENLERAIELYEQVLQVMTRQTMPLEWATTTMNLANTYQSRIQGERAENLERAIELYEQVLQVRTHQAMPIEWAEVTNNLANTYLDRIRGERAKNLERAIELYEQALQVMTRQAMPADWATTTMNLATVYKNRIRGKRAENLECAIKLYEQALYVRTRQAMPVEWAMTTMNLANAYSYRIQGERAENLEQAIELYEQALQIRTRQAMPVDWAMATMNLATAYSDRIRGERAENLERAIEAYKQALEVQTMDVAPADHRQTQRNLADLYFSNQRWGESVVALRAGVAAGELLYQLAATPEARQAELAEIRQLPGRLAYAAAKQGGAFAASEAVLTVEQNRARWLSESLALRTGQPAGVPVALWQRFVDLGQQIQALQAESRLPEATPAKRTYLALSELLHAAYQQLDETIAQIRTSAPDFMPQPSFADLQAAAQASPLVYLLTTTAGGLALIVQADKVTPVWLDGFTEEKLHKLLTEWFGAYSRQRTARQVWLDTMDRVTHALWDAVMGPVAAALHSLPSPSPSVERGSGGEVITLIPTGLLSLLPLHAAWTPQEPHPNPPLGREETVTAARRYFLDEFVVRYAPSARALTHAATTAQQVTPMQLLAVDEPRPGQGNALPNSAAEVAAIADHFAQPHLFAHEHATRAAILAALPQAQVAHFSCHGATDWENALESGLIMANDEPLTVRDLLELQLPGARLATLSACETGIVGTALPDEVVALPSALVQAGFAGVVASLWSVADISTAMLMARFYDGWQHDKLEPAQALRAAQRWVRDTTNREKRAYFREALVATTTERMPAAIAANFFEKLGERRQDARDFAHPYWWAAFYLTGV